MNNNQPSLLLTEAVNRLLSEADLPASLTIEQCASALAMSMTSFRRKLTQEETSFKLIQSKLNTSCKIIVKDKTVIKDHNPKNLNISNSDTKNKIKWNPKFSINLMVDILIKTFKNESRPNN